MFQGCKVKIKIWWWWKAVQKLSIQPLGRRSVHAPAFLVRFLFMVWVGLDSNELDCFRRQVSTLLSWSLLIGTTNESSIYGQLLDQKENEAKQTECFWMVVCFLKSLHWPRALRCSRGWSRSLWPPPPCRPPAACSLRLSAPPWITLVVVLINFAWCHSLLLFRSSPLWLEM